MNPASRLLRGVLATIFFYRRLVNRRFFVPHGKFVAHTHKHFSTTIRFYLGASMGEFAAGRVVFYLLKTLTTGPAAQLVGELSNILSNSWGEFGIGRVR
jgi:hypothetical protein